MRFCTSSNFKIGVDSDGDKCMKIDGTGFDIVLYYSTQCQHCKTYVELFRSSSGRTSNCEFSLVNLDKCKEIIAMTKGTTTELEYVPVVIMYCDGMPYMAYGGDPEVNSFLRFIDDCSKKFIAEKQPSSQEHDRTTHSGYSNNKTNSKPDTGTVTSGCALSDKECAKPKQTMSCYLTFEDAYGGAT